MMRALIFSAPAVCCLAAHCRPIDGCALGATRCNGNVAQICDAAEARHPGLATFRSALVGAHPGLVPLLAERLRQGLVAPPVGH